MLLPPQQIATFRNFSANIPPCTLTVTLLPLVTKFHPYFVTGRTYVQGWVMAHLHQMIQLRLFLSRMRTFNQGALLAGLTPHAGPSPLIRSPEKVWSQNIHGSTQGSLDLNWNSGEMGQCKLDTNSLECFQFISVPNPTKKYR